MFGLLLWSLWPAPVEAQAPDTTATLPPDTVAVSVDSVALPPPVLDPPVGFWTADAGTLIDTLALERAPELDLQGVLSRVPGTLLYDFGTPGWPDGWSWFGLSPNKTALTFNGLPFANTLTGRARYDLLPLAFLEPVRLTTGRYGTSVAAQARLRPFDTPRPITELRYRQSNTGLQAVSVVHAQRRSRTLFRRPGTLGVQFGYSGMASDGEYPGSAVTLGPQSLFRLRYAQRPWSLEIANVHSRREVEAHGGVQPFFNQAYETIYQRFGATVRDANAQRRTVRNDLYLIGRARLVSRAAEPFTTTLYRSREQFRYRNPGTDTLQAKTHRWGFRVQQTVGPEAHRLRLQAEGWTDAVSSSTALPDSVSLIERALHLNVRDSLALGLFNATFQAGWHTTTYASHPSFAISLGNRNIRLHLAQTSEPISRIERWGWGIFIQPGPRNVTPVVRQGRLAVHAKRGWWDARVMGFANAITDGLDLFATATADVSETLHVSETQYRAGLTLDLGWRRASTRGWYVTLQPTWTRYLNPNDSPLHRRLADSYPEGYLQGRVGLRYLLFRGDLGVHLYLKGRLWSAMTGRTFHPQTALLAVPTADARRFGTNGTLDVQLEAGVRTATIFVAFENFTSGTSSFHAGNLHIPDYPLPRRRFRLGVFWPIFD